MTRAMISSRNGRSTNWLNDIRHFLCHVQYVELRLLLLRLFFFISTSTIFHRCCNVAWLFENIIITASFFFGDTNCWQYCLEVVISCSSSWNACSAWSKYEIIWYELVNEFLWLVGLFAVYIVSSAFVLCCCARVKHLFRYFYCCFNILFIIMNNNYPMRTGTVKLNC
jgi:hypothetical protein